ncbi:hypothetical protein Nans01_28620 [Nocardiopsis ansamitocini]|uniref:Uncharacterized protein n=1 Tax=Nocardiopsis ansamitocini TaxID=1670832 RepID=A0A9W6UH60_9ACTN|nr:hypothetical protein Nans01_28620 [Nocardiopsis ansamitocini]
MLFPDSPDFITALIGSVAITPATAPWALALTTPMLRSPLRCAGVGTGCRPRDGGATEIITGQTLG